MTDPSMRRDNAQPTESSESQEPDAGVIKAQEPSADAPRPDQAEPQERQTLRPPSSVWDNAATQVGRFASAAYGLFRDVILGRRATHLVPTAPYVLRTTGILLVVSAIAMPMFSTAIPGIVGWIVDTLVNLFVAYLVFLAVDVMLMLHDLANAAKSGTGAP